MRLCIVAKVLYTEAEGPIIKQTKLLHDPIFSSKHRTNKEQKLINTLQF